MPCWITSSPGGSPGEHKPAQGFGVEIKDTKRCATWTWV